MVPRSNGNFVTEVRGVFPNYIVGAPKSAITFYHILTLVKASSSESEYTVF